MIRRAAILLAASALAIGGCASTDRTTELAAPAELPALSDVVEAFNAPIRPLDRLWARAVVQAITRTDDGEKREQGEGHLQVIRDEQLALSVGKLGDTHLYLACDSERYWWFDMIDGDDKLALVGRHDRVTPVRLEELGLPVHPLELIDLLCITPIDPAQAQLGWSEDRTRVALAAPSRFGVRVVEFETGSLEPVGVKLLDENGFVTVSAEFQGRQGVRVEGLPLGAAAIPERYVIDIPSRNSVIRLRLVDARNRRIAPIVFDFERLVSRFRIENVVDLDGAVARGEGR